MADRHEDTRSSATTNSSGNLGRQQQRQRGGGLPEAVVGQSESPMTGGPRNPRASGSTRDMPPRANRDQDQPIAQGREDEFYDENTRIKQESEFQDATATPLREHDFEPKVTKDADLFGKAKKS